MEPFASTLKWMARSFNWLREYRGVMTQPVLFTPFTVRNLTIRNRVWVPPMCMYSAMGKDGIATDFHQVHYGAMALGMPGLIIVEATAVSPEGRISFHDLGIWNDAQVQALKPIASYIAAQGVVPGIQLGHAGRKGSTYPGWGYPGIAGSTPAEEGGWVTVAPSALSFEGYAQPEALDEAGIAKVVADFAAAARRATPGRGRCAGPGHHPRPRQPVDEQAGRARRAQPQDARHVPQRPQPLNQDTM